MKYFYLLIFSGCILFCPKINALCPHPDLPSDGKYTPNQKKFEPGDEIIYTCNKRFALAGKEKRICQANGVWADHTPFCDPSVPLSDPTVTNNVAAASSILRVIDGKSRTCFDWHNATGEHMYVHLDKTIIVRLVKIFFKQGITKIQILTGLNNDMKLCTEYQNFIETDRWIEIKCENNVLADTLKILVIQTHKRFLSLCEIEVYGKEEDSCEQSPTRTVLYGYFEVSRTKATLICEDGYKSENKRLVCEGNTTWLGGGLRCEEILCNPTPTIGLSGGEWIFSEDTKKLSLGTVSQLRCNRGYKKIGIPDYVTCQKNGTWTKTNATCIEDGNSPTTRRIIYGSIGAFLVLLIIGLLATTIHFIRKHKNKEVVVVYQPQSDGSVPISGSEIEYASPRYEDLNPIPPKPPSSPRPMAKLSTMSRVGAKETKDCGNVTVPQTLPTEALFGTMKASTLYGS